MAETRQTFRRVEGFTSSFGMGWEVGISHGLHICRPSGAFSIIVPLYLGLTPQAKYLPPLRGSGSFRISVIPSEQLVAMKRPTAIGCESRDPQTSPESAPELTSLSRLRGSFDFARLGRAPLRTDERSEPPPECEGGRRGNSELDIGSRRQ
jgi:hypothetical protein